MDKKRVHLEFPFGYVDLDHFKWTIWSQIHVPNTLETFNNVKIENKFQYEY